MDMVKGALDAADFRLLRLMVEDAATQMSKSQLLELADELHDLVRARCRSEAAEAGCPSHA